MLPGMLPYVASGRVLGLVVRSPSLRGWASVLLWPRCAVQLGHSWGHWAMSRLGVAYRGEYLSVTA